MSPSRLPRPDKDVQWFSGRPPHFSSPSGVRNPKAMVLVHHHFKILLVKQVVLVFYSSSSPRHKLVVWLEWIHGPVTAWNSGPLLSYSKGFVVECSLPCLTLSWPLISHLPGAFTAPHQMGLLVIHSHPSSTMLIQCKSLFNPGCSSAVLETIICLKDHIPTRHNPCEFTFFVVVVILTLLKHHFKYFSNITENFCCIV